MRGVVISFVDITGLTRAEDGQRVLIAELHHRTRNLLTVVQAISTLTLGKGGTLKSFTDRLTALGRVQALVSRQGSGNIELAEIVRLELTAHATPDDGRITVAGPTVKLNLDRVQVVALALHELVTNAMKYGALKHESGRLSITWSLENDGMEGRSVVLEWRETGVPMPAQPPRSGYGRQLIERALSHTLGARAAFSFEPDGVRCRVEVPLLRRPGLRDDTSNGQSAPAA